MILEVMPTVAKTKTKTQRLAGLMKKVMRKKKQGRGKIYAQATNQMKMMRRRIRGA